MTGEKRQPGQSEPMVELTRDEAPNFVAICPRVSTRRRYRASEEHGGILVFFSLALIPLLAGLALFLDGFVLTQSRLQQHDAAEYAAEVALKHFVKKRATHCDTSMEPGCQTLKEKCAEFALEVALNSTLIAQKGNTLAVSGSTLKVEADDGTIGRIDFGRVDDPSTGVFTPGAARDDVNAVQVRLWTESATDRGDSVGGPKPMTIFSQLLGGNRNSLDVTATVYYDKVIDDRLPSEAPPTDPYNNPEFFPYRVLGG